MSDWPHAYLCPSTTITPFSEEAFGSSHLQHANAPISQASFASVEDDCMLIPFVIQTPFTVVKCFTMNGATVAGNMDIGVYDAEYNLIVSAGSTAQSGTDSIQEFDVTDTALMPGEYYLALSASDDTMTLYAVGALNDEAAFPAFQLYEGNLTSAPTLSSSLLGLVTKTNAITPRIPLFGISSSTVI